MQIGLCFGRQYRRRSVKTSGSERFLVVNSSKVAMLVFRSALFFGLRMRTPDVVCGLPLAANATRARRRKAAAAATQTAAVKADSDNGRWSVVRVDAAATNGLENATGLGVARTALSKPSGLEEVNAMLLGPPITQPPRQEPT